VKRVSYSLAMSYCLEEGACSDQKMQQMERLLFEEFRGQQELDSERETGSLVIIIREKKRKHPIVRIRTGGADCLLDNGRGQSIVQPVNRFGAELLGRGR
jgi:hypothetical protein